MRGKLLFAAGISLLLPSFTHGFLPRHVHDRRFAGAPRRVTMGSDVGDLNEVIPGSLTVPELKALCKERGLKVGGKKADLVARLQEARLLSDVTSAVGQQSATAAAAAAAATATAAAAAQPPPPPPPPPSSMPAAPAAPAAGGAVLTDDDLFPENSKDPLPQYVDPSRKPRSSSRTFDDQPARTFERSGTRGGGDRDFGPRGHDYERAADDAADGRELGDNEVAKIDELLALRLQAKLCRDFRTADDVQMQLRGMSVEVHDGLKVWRADGGSDFAPARPEGTRKRGVAAYERTTPPDVDLDEAAIEAMIAERGRAKIDGDFQQADELRARLQRDLGVEVSDKSRKWAWVDPATGHPFVPLEGHLTAQLLSDEGALADVHALLKRRFDAKRKRDFRGADEAQNMLRSQGVEVDDLNFRWRYKPAEA
jgi:hypothetical protein